MDQYITQNDEYEILTPDGWSAFSGINRTQKDEYVCIVLSSGKTLDCTLDHKVKTLYGFTEAQHLKSGDTVQTKDGVEEILHVSQFMKPDFYYDCINVSKGNQYYTNDVISHNCEFMGSSGTLIAGWKLKQLTYDEPISSNQGLSLYTQPQENRSYVIVVDVSRGKGLDYSAFQVIDVTNMPYEQVCVFRDNMITPIDYANIIHSIAKHYNNAQVLVEVNDIGEQVSSTLFEDYEYENLLFTESSGRAGKRLTAGFSSKGDKGVRTTKTVKANGCSVLKLLIEQNQLILHDFDTVKELSTFSKKGNSWEAESGCHDDLVMCLVLFAWLSNQTFFKDLTDINTIAELRDFNEDQIMDQLTPFGIVDTGHEQYEPSSVVSSKGDSFLLDNNDLF